MVQSRQKLPGAARNITFNFKDFNRPIDWNLQAGLEVGPPFDADSAAPYKFLRLGAGFRDTAPDEEKIEFAFSQVNSGSLERLQLVCCKSLELRQSSIICVAGSNQSKRCFPTSLKDVEKTHVRDDSLLRGRGRTVGRERNTWRNAVKLH